MGLPDQTECCLQPLSIEKAAFYELTLSSTWITMLTLETPTGIFFSRHSSEYDEALQATAASMLKESGYGPVARLGCRVEHGVVELFGVVPSFYMKQVAQAVVQRLDSVRGIRNEIQVI